MDKPLIVEVSRFDPWKGQENLLEAYNKIREYEDCSLVFVYSKATDDPEGEEREILIKNLVKKSKYNDDIYLLNDFNPILVNALQTAATIVVQPSIKEGFGLTVSEAAWKRTPVVGTNVGGIGEQIIDGVTGKLIEPYQFDKDPHNYVDYEDWKRHIDDIAYSCLDLLSKPKKELEEMGNNAREHIKNNFTLTKMLEDYLGVFSKLLTKN